MAIPALLNLGVLTFFLTCPQTTAGNLLLNSSLPPRMVPITVRIDFGPAHKPVKVQKVTVRDGASPKEALKEVFPVEEGATCCHPEEVKGIDGVSVDPLKNWWWRVLINGTGKNVSPQKSHLKAGDIMEWIYFEDAQ